jgi:hypothetical protein
VPSSAYRSGLAEARSAARRNRLFAGVIVAWGHSETVERATESAKELAEVKLATSSASTRAAAETVTYNGYGSDDDLRAITRPRGN